MLSTLRLIYLVSAGQRLANTMEACSHRLQRARIENTSDQNSKNLALLKKELEYYCPSPISPESAFSLTNNTLMGTFATIITYLIVLIQFKSAENQKPNVFVNETISEMS